MATLVHGYAGPASHLRMVVRLFLRPLPALIYNRASFSFRVLYCVNLWQQWLAVVRLVAFRTNRIWR